MGCRLGFLVFACLFAPLLAVSLRAQNASLVVPAGAALQVSLDKRVAVSTPGHLVEAHLVKPVFAFDREVIPAGSRLTGTVVRLDPISNQKRIRSYIGGDFTPLHDPQIEFDRVFLADGTAIPIKTKSTSGTGAVVRPETWIHPRPSSTWTGRTAELVRAGFANARRQVSSAWESPDKWDRLETTAYSYLPYHPQFVPMYTQISVELTEPLVIQTAMAATKANAFCAACLKDNEVHARLLSTVSSLSDPGTKVEAVVSEPLFSADHKLLLPEGTHLVGTVKDRQAAGAWRHGGSLRFSFQSMELPPAFGDTKRTYRLEAILTRVELHLSNLKVDPEGDSRSVEPATRFLAPALKLLIGSQVVDGDDQLLGQSQPAKGTWRTLAGASGFGVVGSAAAQVSHEAATGLGFYGLGWSVFTHIIERGHNVMLARNTPITLRIVTTPS